MKNINTKLWIRVFFVIAFISFLGIVWQWQKNITSKVKTFGGSFSEGIIGSPRFINPVLAQSNSDKDLTQLIFGSLLSFNQKGEKNLGLAEYINISDDKKTYTLGLKKDLYFNDGEKITIDDLIFTIEKIQDPIIKSPLQNRWEGVKLEKIDSYTVKFILNQKYSDFIHNLSIGILPKHIWENTKNDEFIFSIFNSSPVGSGNYYIKKVHLKKNGIPSDYLLEKTKTSNAYIPHIKLFFYENENDLAQAYRNGTIDAAYGLSANQENRDLFKKTQSITGKLPRVFGLFFNQNKQTLLKDKNIRSLINSAIQRQSLIDKVFAGYAYPINNPFGNKIQEKQDYQKEINTSIQALENEHWLKNESGIYTKKNDDAEVKLSFDLSVPNTSDLITLADEIKKNLQKYGVLVNIRVFDEGNLHQKVIRPRDYEILLFGYMIEKETDLYAFWHSSQKNDPGLNISLYSNSKVDKELEKLRKDKNTADLTLVRDEIAKDVPAVFIYSPAYTYLLPKKIKGENISITERQNRFSQINKWYIYTRSIWNVFIH